MSTLTADHLMQLDAMETDDVEAHQHEHAHHLDEQRARSNSAGSQATFDSDEERHDRLITPRELEEIEQFEKEIAGATSPCYAKVTAAAAAALTNTLTKHIRVGAAVSDEATEARTCESGPLRWYFAYGSNMNVAQLLTRIGAFEDKKLLYLPEHELRFNKRVSLKDPAMTAQRWNRIGPNIAKCGFANVVPAPKKRVYGIAYLIHTSQIEKMDVYEGVSGGHYTRETMTCYDTEHRPVECTVYVATPAATADGLLPTDGYMSHLLGGRGLLPAEYTAMLERQPKSRR